MLCTIIAFSMQSNKLPKEGFTDSHITTNSCNNTVAPASLHHDYPESQQGKYISLGSEASTKDASSRIINKCRPSEIHNPFGNVLIPDMQNKDTMRACSSMDNPQHDFDVQMNFDRTRVKPVADVFNKMSSQRQFFTMPWTRSGPDLDGDFPNWLYDQPPRLKEQAWTIHPYA